MENMEALELVQNVFKHIKQAKTTKDLIDIPEKSEFKRIKDIWGNLMEYPKIEFSIKPSEINELIEKGFINEKFGLNSDITSKIEDPLTKILYATSWKNGDIKKIKHIIKGIKDSDNEIDNQNEALVFYQFGKFLTKNPGQPIIDQHVIRAYEYYRTKKHESRKLHEISKKQKVIIAEYKSWLVSDELTRELKKTENYTYYIDQLLFATGKIIKIKK